MLVNKILNMGPDDISGKKSDHYVLSFMSKVNKTFKFPKLIVIL